jgi:23S rRNA (uracil1939-C5)-methyltransferase
VPVEPPAGGFLQPSAEGEGALVGHARLALAGCRSIADLFSGAGAFTFPLSASARVHAVEGDAAAIAALARAARAAGLAERISTERRDLARDPLPPAMLGRFEGVLFDPPRAGAPAQASAIAASRVPVVVGVSCDPATFARDARIVVDAGFRLGTVTPLDQFPWAPHIELIAAFGR